MYTGVTGGEPLGFGNSSPPRDSRSLQPLLLGREKPFVPSPHKELGGDSPPSFGGEVNLSASCGVRKLIRLSSESSGTTSSEPPWTDPGRQAHDSSCFLTSSPHPRGTAQGSPTPLHVVRARKPVLSRTFQNQKEF